MANLGQIVHTLASSKAPMNGTEWWLNDAVKDEAGAQCQRLSIKAAEIRAEVTRLMSSVPREPQNIEIMTTLMRRAQAVDHEITIWMKSLPEHYQYKTMAWEDHVPNGDYSKAEVFPGRVDFYQDMWTASVWNMARVSRLALLSAIVRCAAWICSPVDYRTTPEYAACAADCVETITDIIASVPYHLGWHHKRPDLIQRSSVSGFACGDEESQKALAGYFLTWPLASINGQDYTTDAQRAWIVGRLRYIGNEVGIRYAHMLADVSCHEGMGHAFGCQFSRIVANERLTDERARALYAHTARRTDGVAVPPSNQLREAALGPVGATAPRLRPEPAPATGGHAQGVRRAAEERSPDAGCGKQYREVRRVDGTEVARRLAWAWHICT